MLQSISPHLNSAKAQALVLRFDQVGIADIPLVGSKNALLGEMFQQLTLRGISVPNGFATTACAYQHFIAKGGLEEKLRQLFSDLDVEDLNNLKERGRRARALVLCTPIPVDLASAIKDAYFKLCTYRSAFAEFCQQHKLHYREAYDLYRYDVAVAVCPSVAIEYTDDSFATQQDYFNVHGPGGVLDACHRCFASLFADRAISYRVHRGFDHFDDFISVGVQKLERSTLQPDTEGLRPKIYQAVSAGL